LFFCSLTRRIDDCASLIVKILITNYCISMDKTHLEWKEENRKKVFEGKIFSVWESYCKSPEVKSDKNDSPETKPHAHVFSLIDTKDWAIVIPVIESGKGKQFLMVWQWRHGVNSMSLEFPGGVLEPGENPQEAAARELYEETGYKPGKIKKIGEFSPNPAIMTNKVHFFLAENIESSGKQKLDEDEYVEATLVDAQEVINGMGKEPYVHALMGTALALYLKTPK